MRVCVLGESLYLYYFLMYIKHVMASNAQFITLLANFKNRKLFFNLFKC